MAFGGVATGSMKAIELERVATIMNGIAGIPMAAAAPTSTGMAMVVVAALEVSSVRNTKRRARIANRRIVGTDPSPATDDPIHSDSPERSMARASDRPPPKRMSTPQGMRRARRQVRIA